MFCAARDSAHIHQVCTPAQAGLKALTAREKQLLTATTLEAELEAKRRAVTDLEVGAGCAGLCL